MLDMSDTVNIIIVLVLSVTFIILLYIIISYRRKTKNAIESFARSRGLIIQHEDKEGELNRKLVDKIGFPDGGFYENIVRLSLSVGEAYLFSGYAGVSTKSKAEMRSENYHHFISVFMDLGLNGRTFVLSHPEIKGEILNKLLKYFMEKFEIIQGLDLLDIGEQNPIFAKTHSVFSEDKEGVNRLLLSSGVLSTLIDHPGGITFNILFSPGGFHLDIYSLITSTADIESFVIIAENLAQELNDIKNF